MNDEIFRLSLIDVMNEGLLNDFVNDIFGYDFDIKKEEYVYIQYKILGDNVILNIYDNKNNNRFKAYIFTMNDIDNDEDTKYINVKEEYDKYKNRLDDTLSPVEKDFIESIGMLEQITDSSKKQHFLFYILTPAYQRQQQRDEDELKYRKERFEREKRDAEYYRDRAGAGYEDARGGDGLFTTAVEKRKNAGKDLDTANWHAQQASYEEQRIADLERKLGKQMRYKWI